LSARKTAISDFSIVKYVDTASPQLFAGCCTGQHIPEASFAVRKAGEQQLEYYKIKLTDVLISSVAPAGSAGGGNTLESVSFSFGAADIYAASQDPKGGIGGTSTAVCGGSSDLGDVIVEKRR
jgi:type VI secretion system secreted protein Hcp